MGTPSTRPPVAKLTKKVRVSCFLAHTNSLIQWPDLIGRRLQNQRFPPFFVLCRIDFIFFSDLKYRICQLLNYCGPQRRCSLGSTLPRQSNHRLGGCQIVMKDKCEKYAYFVSSLWYNLINKSV